MEQEFEFSGQCNVRPIGRGILLLVEDKWIPLEEVVQEGDYQIEIKITPLQTKE